MRVERLRHNFALQQIVNVTRVVASKAVAVFSGNYYTGIPEDDSLPADHVTEQVPPITTWGTRFALTPTPDVLNGEQYIFLAAEDDTEIILHTVATTEEVSTCKLSSF